MICTCTGGSSFVVGKVTTLWCAVLLCLVVYLTLIASFFLPSHLSLKHLPVLPVSGYVHVYSLVDFFHAGS